MNSKWHLYISFVKSGVRILSCIGAIFLNSVVLLGLGFLCAEFLGIVEELGDRR